MRLFLSATLVAVGCATTNQLAEDAGTGPLDTRADVLMCADEDGDGEGAIACGGTDCDDSDPARRYDTVEICNGVVDSCEEEESYWARCEPAANATQWCCAGGCILNRCADGFADCDGILATGCESTGPCDTSPIVQLEGGVDFSCARRASGRVVCWGSMWMHDRLLCQVSNFMQVLEVGAAVDISSNGSSGACVVSADGRVACWGDNSSGQTGAPLLSGWSAPNWVRGITIARGVALTTHHACAAMRSGQVRCWGANFADQLGFTGPVGSVVPFVIHGVDDAVDVAVAQGVSCALKASGRVACWGLGIGPTPIEWEGVEDAREIKGGGFDICALRSDASVWCIGISPWGEIGPPSQRVPVRLPVSNVVAFGVGHAHICVTQADGTVLCAGWNDSGQLGDGTRETRAEYRHVPSLDGSAMVVPGFRQTLSLLADGRVRGIGSNAGGELDGDANSDSTLVLDVTIDVP